jgi:ceramide glucosyltransferase
MDVLVAAATTGLAIALASHFASIALAMRRAGRTPRGPRPPAGVSILRPVCGLEYGIEATIASSFRIDHPSYEVIFCVAAADDPAVPIVRRLIGEHPEIPARLLVGGERRSPNPKLDNLMKGWDAAANDWIVVADSNVLIPPDYLDRLFARWSERCAVVCSPPLGVDVQGWAAGLEAAFLNTFQARWQLAGDEIGFGFAQGKTMLLRRSDLAPDGGLAALAREVAEDAAATKLARRRGRVVRVVDQPFPQPIGPRRFAGVWRRQLRWARLRRLSFPGCFCAELPAGGVFPFLLAGSLAIESVLPWLGVLAGALVWYGAEALLARTFGWPLEIRSPLFWIARDLLLPVLWARAWMVRNYEWRGNAVDASPAARAAPPGAAASHGGAEVAPASCGRADRKLAALGMLRRARRRGLHPG